MTVLAGWRTYQVAAPTTSGDQTLTTDLDGYTPKAMVIEMPRAHTSGSPQVQAIMGMGATDGTRQICFSCRDQNGLTTTSSGGRRASGSIIQYVNANNNNANAEATWSSFAADQAVINWSDPPTAANLMNVTFFYGDLLQADVQSLPSSSTLNGTASVTGLSFAPNMVWAWGCDIGFPGTPGTFTDFRYHHGVAVDNEGTIEQNCVGMYSRSGQTINSAAGAIMRDDSIMQSIQITSTGFVMYTNRVEVTSFNSDGFTVTTRNTATSMIGIYLSLYVGANRRTVQAVDMDTATSGTGSAKKFTTSSGGNSWKPSTIRVVGSGLSVA